MNSLKKGEGVLLSNIEGGPRIPLLNFEGGPGSWGLGPTFTPCRLFTAIWKSRHRHLGISIGIEISIGIGIVIFFCLSKFLEK